MKVPARIRGQAARVVRCSQVRYMGSSLGGLVGVVGGSASAAGSEAEGPGMSETVEWKITDFRGLMVDFRDLTVC